MCVVIEEIVLWGDCEICYVFAKNFIKHVKID